MSRIRAMTQRRYDYRARMNDIYRRRQRQIWIRIRNTPTAQTSEHPAYPAPPPADSEQQRRG